MNLARLALTVVATGASLLLTTTARAAYQHVAYDAATDGALGLPFERFDAAHFGSTFGNAIVNPYFGSGYSPTDESNGTNPYFSGSSSAGQYTFWYLNTLTLDASAGIELAAMLKIGASQWVGDRTGVALALTDSGNQYTELYIAEDRIFLNRVGRVHLTVDEYEMDTQAGFHDYLLRVNGGTVSVLVDGTVRLTGSTFAASTDDAPTLANWAVFGDITRSAAGSYYLESASVTVVPEPTGLIACGMMVPLLMRRRTTRRA